MTPVFKATVANATAGFTFIAAGPIQYSVQPIGATEEANSTSRQAHAVSVVLAVPMIAHILGGGGGPEDLSIRFAEHDFDSGACR